MLYILHGDDEFTRSQELAKLRGKLGDSTVASLNTTVLNGADLNLAALRQACDSLPFMAQRRLVIVQDFWSRFEAKERGRTKERRAKVPPVDAAVVKDVLEYLPRLPETTHLAFVESCRLGTDSPILHSLPADRKQGYIKEFKAPAGRELESWIEQRVKSKGGEITSQAVQELGRLVGNDLRQLENELDKLLAYADLQRAVTMTDVYALVSAAHTANVFALVDAMGMRQCERAIAYLHELLDGGAAPLYLLTMIERQFRILLQVKELREHKATNAQMQTTLGIRQDFVIEKSLRQTQRFSMERLEVIYNRLAEVEQSIKTGEISDLLALDVLVVELCT